MKRETFWTAGALITRAITQLLLTYAVITHLSKNDSALWFVFMSFWAVVQLLDMGLSMAVLRGASYLWAGQKDLKPQGFGENENHKPNISGLKDLLVTMNTVYACLGGLVVLVGLVLAHTLMSGLFSSLDASEAWLFFCTAAAFQLMLSQRYNYLQGIGQLVIAQQLSTLCTWIGFGITAAVMCYSRSLLLACQTMTVLWLLQLFIFDVALNSSNKIDETNKNDEAKENEVSQGKGKFCWSMLLSLWPNSWRAGLSRLSLALIYHLPTLIISRVIGIIPGGQYGFTIQLCLFVQALGQVPVTAVTPRLHELAAQEKLPEVRNLFFVKLRQTMLLDILLFLGVIFIAPLLISYIKAQTTLLPLALLIPVVIFFLLEHHRNNFVLLVSVFNRFPFWKYDLMSGIIAAAGATFVLHAFGVVGFIAFLWVIQLSWNFWWPVKEGLRLMKSSWSEYLKALAA